MWWRSKQVSLDKFWLYGKRLTASLDADSKWDNFCPEKWFQTTGMPEGDPLSCLGMILCDFYFHCYFSRYLPSIYVFSYVDNLSLISTQAPLLVQGGTGFPSLAPNAGLVAGSQKKLWVEHLSTGSEDSGWKWLHYPMWGSRLGSTTSVWHQSSGVIQRWKTSLCPICMGCAGSLWH